MFQKIKGLVIYSVSSIDIVPMILYCNDILEENGNITTKSLRNSWHKIINEYDYID